MSSIVPSPIGPATTAKRGTMSAADKTKLDALPANTTLEARFGAIETDVTTAEGNITTLQGQVHAAVTLDGASSSWLTLVGQVLKLTLVAAGAAVEGIVTTAAQTFAGVKTFAAEAVFSAGLVATGVRAIGASLLLRSDLGAGASDVCNVVGTSVADGSVNASAKVAAVSTGIGGTQVDLAWWRKSGQYIAGILEVGGSSGSAFMDTTVAFAVNSAAKTWLFNMYNTGGHVMSLSRLGRFVLNGPIGSAAQGATAIIRRTANETVLRVESTNTDTALLQEWRKNYDTTPVAVAKLAVDGTFEATGAGVGIVLASPDGTRYRLTVANGGTLSIAAA